MIPKREREHRKCITEIAYNEGKLATLKEVYKTYCIAQNRTPFDSAVFVLDFREYLESKIKELEK